MPLKNPNVVCNLGKIILIFFAETSIFLTQDDQESCTVFNGVSYLGAAKMNAPKSEAEIQRNMKILNAESANQDEIKVSISIPNCSQGSVM